MVLYAMHKTLCIKNTKKNNEQAMIGWKLIERPSTVTRYGRISANTKFRASTTNQYVNTILLYFSCDGQVTAKETAEGLVFTLLESFFWKAEAIAGGDFSRPTLFEAVVRGGAETWKAVISFCRAVIQASSSSPYRRQTRCPVRLRSLDDLRSP